MTKSPYVGAQVLVVVPKSTNGGLDHAPATVTRVNADATVNLHALVDVGQPIRVEQARLCTDRAAAVKVMAEHYKLLPGAHSVEAPDGSTVAVPGRNSTNGEPWNYSDVAHWVKLAYWGDGTEPTGADTAAPAAVTAAPAESPADRVARLRAELEAAELAASSAE